MKNVNARKSVLLGYGDIASRLAKISIHGGKPVTAVRRSSTNQRDIECIAADATSPEAIKAVLRGDPCDIVVTLTPDKYDEQSYRDSYLACAQALAKVLPKHSPDSRVIFVSSTSVYGQNSGEWVDEESHCAPQSATARVLIESEQAISSAGFESCNLRFSGIYGPGRTRMINSVRDGKIAPAVPVHWTNRIHAEDCARVINFLLSLPAEKLPKTVIGTDHQHAPRRMVQEYIARLLDVTLPPSTQNEAETDCQASPQKGKRCFNGLLRDLGYEFKYPSFEEGFKALIDSEH